MIRERPEISVLIDLLGEDQFWKVAAAFAGSSVYFPKAIMRDRRDGEIRCEYLGLRKRGLSHGAAIKNTARIFKLTERRTRAILAGNEGI